VKAQDSFQPNQKGNFGTNMFQSWVLHIPQGVQEKKSKCEESEMSKAIELEVEEVSKDYPEKEISEESTAIKKNRHNCPKRVQEKNQNAKNLKQQCMK
jgi:hypothetical protein